MRTTKEFLKQVTDMHTNPDFPPRINFPTRRIAKSENLHFSGLICVFSATIINLSSRIADQIYMFGIPKELSFLVIDVP